MTFHKTTVMKHG